MIKIELKTGQSFEFDEETNELTFAYRNEDDYDRDDFWVSEEDLERIKTFFMSIQYNKGIR